MNISVIICTYNGSLTINKCLEHIKNQHTFLSFEVIVVDNNSSDDTYLLANKWIFQNKEINAKIFKIKKRGKAFALRHGINESKGEFVIICDDDNFLNENYLDIAYKFMSENPNVGLCAGVNMPCSNDKIPDWFYDSQVLFGCGSLRFDSGSVDSIWGAGMVCKGILVREIYCSKIVHIMEGFDDKLGTRIMGEDDELCFWVKNLGYKLWFNIDLKLNHFMRKDRLTYEYLIKLERSLSLGNEIFKKMREIFYHASRKTTLSDFFYIFKNTPKAEGIKIRLIPFYGNRSIKNNIKVLNSLRKLNAY